MAFDGNFMCTSFKKELMEAKHNFLNSGGSTFRLSLYTNSATITARGGLLYNDSVSGDPSCLVLDFGGDKTSTAGDFTVQFPAADASNAIIRIA